ncbi:MAG: M48 family metallopeptidase [Rhizobiales bacterium]|nr:M48 family metallopeptidase [Hyphomicrobiales bacterium]
MTEIPGRRLFVTLFALIFAFVQFAAVAEAAKKAPARAGLPLIRDAEIEGLLRQYTRPIFKAAGINPKAVRVYIINDPRINAFVAGGQRIFVNTGLITQSKTPNELIGVLAHETGHIAGAHLARLGIEVERASIQSIIGMIAGAAAMVGGSMAGSKEAARAGQGVMLGSQGLAQRNVLAYQRSMEAAADQAALKYLDSTGQSARGMLNLFRKLANQSIASAQYVDPYVLSHPMPFDRIRNLEAVAKTSPNFKKPDRPEMVLRHELVQAKLAGFLQPPQTVFQRYPKSDTSMPARYARSISMFRKGDLKNALPLIDSLVDELPENPYFWELKGQALLEGGQPAKAVGPLRQANKLLPSNGLIQMMLAQALIGTENAGNAKPALDLLRAARKSEGQTPQLYRFMALAYGQLNDIPRAELATAEASLLSGDRELAMEKAKIAQSRFKQGSPEWLRANDILTIAERK